MRIVLKTHLNAKWQMVKGHFDRELFLYLLPPGASLVKYEGAKPGDIVHIAFAFPISTEWISEITETYDEPGHFWFVDIGRKLPAGLVHWKHIHHIYERPNGCEIVDDMSFSTGNRWRDRLMYPFLYAAFLPRILQYRTYFKTLSSKLQEAE